jgi:hypothetical protein
MFPQFVPQKLQPKPFLNKIKIKINETQFIRLSPSVAAGRQRPKLNGQA